MLESGAVPWRDVGDAIFGAEMDETCTGWLVVHVSVVSVGYKRNRGSRQGMAFQNRLQEESLKRSRTRTKRKEN